METHVWKVGDPCFIVHCGSDPHCIRMQIMPALVTQVFDAKGTRARALAFTKAMAGPHSEEGPPFLTEAEARTWLKTYAANITKACENATVSGERPEWELEKNMPALGDLVYTLWPEQKEILQVTVGIVRIEHGVTQVAYDQCPGNPEASNVHIKRWWLTREAAEIYVSQNHGEGWTYVSKEELAARVTKEIDQIFDDAAKRLKDPAWLAEFDNFARGLNAHEAN